MTFIDYIIDFPWPVVYVVVGLWMLVQMIFGLGDFRD